MRQVTRQVKRKSEKIKNEMMRETIHACLQNALQFRFVLMDSWFSFKKNFGFITSRGKYFISALKNNRPLKSNVSMAKSPTQTLRTQSRHVFVAIYAVFKLECLRVRSKIKLLALRLKLLINATRSAFGQLQKFQAAAQGQLLNCPGQ